MKLREDINGIVVSIVKRGIIDDDCMKERKLLV